MASLTLPVHPNGSTLREPHNLETRSVRISHYGYFLFNTPLHWLALQVDNTVGDLRGTIMLITGPGKLSLVRAIDYLNSRMCPYVPESVTRIEPRNKGEGKVHTAREALLGKPGALASRLLCCLVATVSSFFPSSFINSPCNSTTWASPHPLDS